MTDSPEEVDGVETHSPEEVDDVSTYVDSYDSDERASVSVAKALAEVRGVDPTEVTLHDYVDPEALDRLFEPRADGTPRGEGLVAFEVEEYRVTVRSDGTYRIGRSDD